MLATQILPENRIEEKLEEENDSEVVGILSLDNTEYEIKKGETKIGRDSKLCAIVIDNFTVSKIHAVIESDGKDDTFIYDVGSTNQTKLGKKNLKPHCRYKLDNGSIVTLGNILGKFIIPLETKDYYFKTETITPPNSGGKKSSFVTFEELGDIFDLPTQVAIPQPSTSKDILKTCQVFKVPNAVPLAKEVNVSSQAAKSCFDEVTQCQLYSQNSEHHNSVEENLSIFNLSTQCPVSEPPLNAEESSKQKEIPCESKNDVDKIKSLLNDGQDDVLLTFMSLHSPNGQNKPEVINKEEIKKEVVSEDISEILDATTQLNHELVQEKFTASNEIEELKVLLNNKSFNEEFCDKSSPKPNRDTSICESPRLKEEDLISTQEFSVQTKPTTKNENCVKPKEENLIQHSETESYLEIALDDSSLIEQMNNDEDFILTQKFSFSEKCQENLHSVKNEEKRSEEDLLSTQVFDGKKTENVKECITAPSDEVPQNPDDDESFLEVTLDFTQRDKEEDFIQTQVFTTPNKTNDTSIPKNLASSSDNKCNIWQFSKGLNEPSQIKTIKLEDSGDNDSEDFIATQVFELPVCGTTKPTHDRNEEIEPVSPDLLFSSYSPKNSQDSISTQVFNFNECKNQVSLNSVVPKVDELVPRTKVPVCNISDSSGDETESDLEIMVENIIESKFCPKTDERIKSEPEATSTPKTLENDDDNSSYVFELEPEDPEANAPEKLDKREQPQNGEDSDATDCGENEPLVVKREPPERVEYEDTQVLTLSLPSDFVQRASDANNDWMVGGESPKFELGNTTWENESNDFWNIKEPNKEEIAKTSNKTEKRSVQTHETPRKKIEVKARRENSPKPQPESSANKPIDTSLKRVRENKNGSELLIKKPKTSEVSDMLLRSRDRQISRLWKAHDITQIQPNRTRNSRNFPSDKISGSDFGTSRRKGNPTRGNSKKQTDITSYIKKKEESKKGRKGDLVSPKEKTVRKPAEIENVTRILRSTGKNSPGWFEPTTTKSILGTRRRNSRTRNPL